MEEGKMIQLECTSGANEKRFYSDFDIDKNHGNIFEK